MLKSFKAAAAILAMLSFARLAEAKQRVKVGFIGPLTGGTSSNGLGGRNSADVAVRLRNADPKAKYEYEMVVRSRGCSDTIALTLGLNVQCDQDKSA